MSLELLTDAREFVRLIDSDAAQQAHLSWRCCSQCRVCDVMCDGGLKVKCVCVSAADLCNSFFDKCVLVCLDMNTDPLAVWLDGECL